MSEERKSTKKKNLIRYIVLAACILVIAAVTVTIVAAANNWFKPDLSAGVGETEIKDPPADNEDKPTGGNSGEENGEGSASENNPASSVTTLAMPVSSVDITKEYDFLPNPSLCGQWSFHGGVDMSAEAGAEVMACLDGTIKSITVGDYLDGTSITITHENGLTTVYCFIDAKENLKAGDKVKRGEVIGTVAQPCGKEFLDGAHLHFEIYENGAAIDPASKLDVAIK